MRSPGRHVLRRAIAILDIAATNNTFVSSQVTQRQIELTAEELRRCLTPSPGSKSRRAKQAKKKAEKRLETDEIYKAVEARAGGVCECGCGRRMIEVFDFRHQELDHFFSRRNGQSTESCWMLASCCHERKTNNNPSAIAWLEKFRAHCIRHGYWAEAAKAGKRIDYLTAKSRLTKRRSA